MLKLWIITLLFNPFCLQASENYLYGPVLESALEQIDTEMNSISSICADPRGRKIYIAVGHEIFSFDLYNGKHKRLHHNTEIITSPLFQMIFSKTENKIVVRGAGPNLGRIFLINTEDEDQEGEDLLFNNPDFNIRTVTSMALSPNGRYLYLCEYYIHRICIYDRKENSYALFMGVSNIEGHYINSKCPCLTYLSKPSFITISSDGTKMLISDSGNHRVLELSFNANEPLSLAHMKSIRKVAGGQGEGHPFFPAFHSNSANGCHVRNPYQLCYLNQSKSFIVKCVNKFNGKSNALLIESESLKPKILGSLTEMEVIDNFALLPDEAILLSISIRNFETRKHTFCILGPGDQHDMLLNDSKFEKDRDFSKGSCAQKLQDVLQIPIFRNPYLEVLPHLICEYVENKDPKELYKRLRSIAKNCQKF